MAEPLRLGILSTASINALAVLGEAPRVGGLRVQAVASRSLAAAEAYANRHSIPQAYGSYEELLEQPYLDAVYIPLPNSLHAGWSLRALEAGKHVLCEKPMATSTKEAETLLRAQRKSDLVLMEAMHYRHHPLARGVEAAVRGGEIGDMREAHASFCQWLPGDRHIRYSRRLKGGALNDLGCYTVDAVRWLAGCDSARVESASLGMMHTGVDHTARARLRFSNGVRASVHATFRHLFPVEFNARGTRGSLRVFSPFLPVAPLGPLRLPVARAWVRAGLLLRPLLPGSLETSYFHQLRAFRDGVRGGGLPLTSAEACLATARIMDAIRRKARVP